MPDTPRTDPAPADAPLSPKPAAKRFRRPFNAVRPSADQMRRQGRVAQAAWSELGGRDAVMAFLNDHHDGLGGRPLDVAVASDEGLLAVEHALAERRGG